MRKKMFLMIGSLVVLSTLSGICAAPTQKIPRTAIETPLRYGILSYYYDDDFEIDPHLAESGSSKDHINQIAEGLYAYDLGSHDGGIIPRLAAGCGTWNANTSELTVPLRENVTFHDGTAFNASAVKWNFDRLYGFIERGETQIARLYEPLADLYPATPLVINETVVNSEFEVKFMLNYPFAALVPLLCFTGSAIISPAATNETKFLEAGTNLLVGTGPYVHVNTTTKKTVFEAYPAYYRGTPAVQHMEWIGYEDTTTTSTALLAHEIDLGDVSTEFLDEFEASPNITVGQPMKSTVIHYLSMNNQLITEPIRQAISYAIDYDSIIYDLRDGNAARMTTPVPEGITYHNPDVQPAKYNVTRARQILIDAGLSHGLTIDSSDQDWIDLSNNDPIGTYNYTYNYGPMYYTDIARLVKTNCRAIGIRLGIVDSELYSWFYLDMLLGNWNKFGLIMRSCGADYNDPSNYINPFFSNTSLSNTAQVNDPWLQTAMMEAIADTNQTSRKAKYFAIQEYIVEDLMPWVFLYVGIGKNVLANTITNWNRNPMWILDFFSCTFHGEDTFISDPLMGTSCGFETPWDYYSPPEHTEEDTTGDTHGDIPGYTLLAVISVSVLTITSLLSNHRKRRVNTLAT